MSETEGRIKLAEKFMESEKRRAKLEKEVLMLRQLATVLMTQFSDLPSHIRASIKPVIEKWSKEEW